MADTAGGADTGGEAGTGTLAAEVPQRREPPSKHAFTKRSFTKVYPRGWDTLAGLVDNRAAAKLYVFLAQHCGHDNALVCTYDVLSEELGLHERTIRRAVRDLEAGKHVTVAKVGTANAYILNPDEVWKTYDHHKRFCAFRARTLVSKKQNPDLKRRLTHMLGQQPELFGGDDKGE